MSVGCPKTACGVAVWIVSRGVWGDFFGSWIAIARNTEIRNEGGKSIQLLLIRYLLDGFPPSGTSGLFKPGMTLCLVVINLIVENVDNFMEVWVLAVFGVTKNNFTYGRKES